MTLASPDLPMSMTGTVGHGNEATDIEMISVATISTDASTVTGAAYVQDAVTLETRRLSRFLADHLTEKLTVSIDAYFKAEDAIIIAGVVSVTGKEPSSGRRSWAGAT